MAGVELLAPAEVLRAAVGAGTHRPVQMPGVPEGVARRLAWMVVLELERMAHRLALVAVVQA